MAAGVKEKMPEENAPLKRRRRRKITAVIPDVSEGVKELRSHMGLTQQEFAQVLRTAIASVARYEAGKSPNAVVLLRLREVAQECHRLDLDTVFKDALRSVRNRRALSKMVLVFTGASQRALLNQAIQDLEAILIAAPALVTEEGAERLRRVLEDLTKFRVSTSQSLQQIAPEDEQDDEVE